MKEYKEVIFHLTKTQDKTPFLLGLTQFQSKIRLYGSHLRAQIIEGDEFFIVQAFDRDGGNYIQHLGIAYDLKVSDDILEAWVDDYQVNILESSWY